MVSVSAPFTGINPLQASIYAGLAAILLTLGGTGSAPGSTGSQADGRSAGRRHTNHARNKNIHRTPMHVDMLYS